MVLLDYGKQNLSSYWSFKTILQHPDHRGIANSRSPGNCKFPVSRLTVIHGLYSYDQIPGVLDTGNHELPVSQAPEKCKLSVYRTPMECKLQMSGTPMKSELPVYGTPMKCESPVSWTPVKYKMLVSGIPGNCKTFHWDTSEIRIAGVRDTSEIRITSVLDTGEMRNAGVWDTWELQHIHIWFMFLKNL